MNSKHLIMLHQNGIISTFSSNMIKYNKIAEKKAYKFWQTLRGCRIKMWIRERIEQTIPISISGIYIFFCLSFVDINECTERQRSPCSHTCLNTKGSFQCRCPAGMELGADRRTCLGKSTEYPAWNMQMFSRSRQIPLGTFVVTIPLIWNLVQTDKHILES